MMMIVNFGWILISFLVSFFVCFYLILDQDVYSEHLYLDCKLLIPPEIFLDPHFRATLSGPLTLWLQVVQWGVQVSHQKVGSRYDEEMYSFSSLPVDWSRAA